MPKSREQTSNSLLDRLTTLRPGPTEDQDDQDRDELFSDPTPYFTLSNNFGLYKSQYDQFRDGQKIAFRPTSIGSNKATEKRTRGIAGQRENKNRDIDAVPPAEMKPRGSGKPKGKKR